MENTDIKNEFNLEVLKDAVVRLLTTKYDFLLENAETTVEESSKDKADLWHENADPEDLAKYLASDDDDE